MADSTPSSAPGEALRLAVEAARRGDPRTARSIAESALANGGDTAPLHAFLGVIDAREGKPEGAIVHLRAAHSLRPNDVTIACNLIALLQDNDRPEEALEIASRELAAADPSLRVARLRAFLAQQSGRFEDAVATYERIVAQAPEDFASWNNLGNARSALGDWDGAIAALERATALDPQAAPTRLNLATALAESGSFASAEEILRRTAAEYPADPHPPYRLHTILKSQLKQDEAIVALEEAAARDPGSADIQIKLGVEYGVVRRTNDAERAYLRTLELRPTERDAYLGLAIQYEHQNREEEFAPLLERARANAAPAGVCDFIASYELRRKGDFAAALATLDRVPHDIEPIRAAYLRGNLLDRLGRTDEAFGAYTNANELMQQESGEPLERARNLREELQQQIDLLSREWVDSWGPEAPEDGLPDPVFLVGFPRSGTTLLDTILMGHPRTVVMEEQPPLNIVEEEIGGMAALPALDAAAIARARARYFEEVEKIQPLAPGKVLIDKSPLFLYRLPLIQRLFPRAKVILALRHPCDVVLSCFMSNFRLNRAMANFLQLEDAASLYDLSFMHFEKSLYLLPVDTHRIVYERLVEDVEAEVRPLLDWLGLEWNAGVLDHRSTAKSRGLITTASYSQVTEPIYSRAAGRWNRYRRHLEPVFDTLAPWSRKLGYGELTRES